MRCWVVCGLLAALMLAGCAETQLEDETTDGATGDGSGDDASGGVGAGAGNATGDAAGNASQALAGTLAVEVDNTTVQAGMPFNVTLVYEGDNGTDGAGLAWAVTFQNATDAASYNGTGLPAVLEANLTLLGNVTLTGNATDGNSSIAFEPVTLVVEPAVDVPVDPCAGVPVQEPVTSSGILAPGAANTGFVTSNTFNVEPCQTGMTIDVEVTGAADIIIRLYEPDGTETDYDSNFVGGETWEFAPERGLLPGEHNAQMRAFATVAGTYEMTITFHG